MAERGLGVDHSTIGRWVLRYALELHKRILRDTRNPNRSVAARISGISPAIDRFGVILVAGTPWPAISSRPV